MRHDLLDVFSKLVLQIYRASAEKEPQQFQDAALEIVKPVLPFDTSMWGVATHQPGVGLDIHHIHLHNTPQSMISEYGALKHMDSCADAVAGHLQVTMGFHSATRFADRPVREYRDYLRRYGHENLFISTLADPHSKAVQWVTLFRANPDQQCRADELSLLSQLSPHLMQAMRHSLIRQLDQASFLPGDASMQSAIADQHGVIHYATPGWAELQLAEFGSGTSTRLPASLLDWMKKTASPYVGRSCVAMHRVHHDLVYIRMRAPHGADHLPPRQREVARLIASGLNYKQAAQHLGLSPATVRNHTTEIYRRLDVHNAPELARALGEAPE